MLNRQLVPIGLLAAVAATGCDAGTFLTDPGDTEVPVTVRAVLPNLIVAGVSVEITGPGIPSPIVANLPISDSVAQGTVVVLAGSDRAVTLRAFDDQGLETHRGTDTVDITSSGTTIVDVPLSPLTGTVEIGGRVGGFSVTVSPLVDTLTVGETATFTATVQDADGNPVANPEVVWGSLNPAVASVDSAGVVQALVPGSSTIGASFRGYSTTAAVVVQ